MKPRDPLLGAPPVAGRDALTHVGTRERGRWGRRLTWLSYGHMAFAVAALVGWEHLDVVWPSSLLPDGAAVGGERQMVGFLSVGDPGRPARLATSANLIGDWQRWIVDDVRQDSSECLALSDEKRTELVEGARPRPGSAGLVHYWVEGRARKVLARLSAAKVADSN